MENMTAIYSEKGKARTWLEDALDDHDIPYQAAAEPYWSGIKMKILLEKRVIYVAQEHCTQVQSLIDAYNSSALIPPDDMDEFSPDGIPLVQCRGCLRSIEFDYPKCPFCGLAV